MRRIWNKALKKATAFLLAIAMVASPVTDFGAMSRVQAEEATWTLIEANGYEEGAYVKWAPVAGANGYTVAVSKNENSGFVNIDNELIREYGTYYRADALGLTEGTWYIRVSAGAYDNSGTLTTDLGSKTAPVTVTKYDRSGFAFSTASDVQPTEGIGAYKPDGTLKDGAQVIYVTKDTAKTVTADIHTDAKGNVATFTGLQAILDAKQKGDFTSNDILDIRIIGLIEAKDVDNFSSSAEGIQIKGKSDYAKMNVTIEGVGEDAAVRGFGFLIRSSCSVELRNFAVMRCLDDGISMDTGNSNIWVHNMDIFYGKNKGGDQKKGDGSIDLKGDSKFLTVSYNHLWDCGKTSLCGMKSESGPNYVTYHHNWFDHSDSRHPRIRTMSVHIYNNYYDGVAKYGVGACTGGDAFVERNFFRNSHHPMMVSMQGTDLYDGATKRPKGTFSGENGGSIKAYDNAFEGDNSVVYYGKDTYLYKGTEVAYNMPEGNTVNFDAYLVDNRGDEVPETVTARQGGDKYNNFDTKIDLGVNESDITPAAQVPDVVKAKAGRHNGGDFQYTFNNATDDKDYEINAGLDSKIDSYTSPLAAVGGAATIKYTVTFDVNGSTSTVGAQSVSAGGKATKPADPVPPTGFAKFAGWYNTVGDERWSFDTDRVTQDITLKAKYFADPTSDDGDDGGNAGTDPGGDGATLIETDVVVYDITKSGTSSAYFEYNGSKKNINKNSGTSGSYTHEKLGATAVSCTGNPLKLEADTSSITFRTKVESTVVLLLGSSQAKKVNIDGVAYKAASGVIEKKELRAGKHTIERNESADLYAIIVIPTGEIVTNPTITINPNNGEDPVTLTLEFGERLYESDITDALAKKGLLSEDDVPVKEGKVFSKWADVNGNAIHFPVTLTADSMIVKAVYADAETGEEETQLLNLKMVVDKDLTTGTFNADFEAGGFTFHAQPNDSEEKFVKVVGKSRTINGTSYTNCFQTTSAGTKDYRSISFTAAAPADLYIAVTSSNGDGSRYLGVGTLDGDDKFVALDTTYKKDGAAATPRASDGTIEIVGNNLGNKNTSYVEVKIPKAGKYYIYSKDGGLNIYEIKLTYEGGVDLKSYPVTFNLNSEEATDVEPQPVVAGSKATEPVTYWDGHEVEGWYTDPDLQNKYDFNTPVSGPVSLYAKWNTVAKDTSLVLDMADLPTMEYNKNFSKNGFSFTAASGSAMTVEANTQTVGEVTYTKRLKTNGTGDASKRNIKFTITEPMTLTVVCASSNTSTARALVVSGPTATEITAVASAAPAKQTKELAAGSYTLYAKKDGVNIYYIALTTDGGSGEENPPEGTNYNMSLNVGRDIPSANYTSDFTRNGFTVHATAEDTQNVVVEGNAQKLGDVDYTSRMKLGGVGTPAYRSISFKVTADATLSFAALSSSGSEQRNVTLATVTDGAFTDVASKPVAGSKTGTCTGSFTLAGPAEGETEKEYYLYSNEGGVNIYALELKYTGGQNPSKVTVTFNTNGGLSVDNQSMLSGEKCLNPGEGLKGGSTFAGWYADPELTTPYDFAQAVTANTTVYAKWTDGEANYKDLSLNMADLPARDFKQTYSKNGFTFMVTDSKFVSTEDVNDTVVDGVTYTRRLKLNGKGSTTERAIRFMLTAPSTVTIVAASGSSGTARALVASDGTTETTISDAIDGAAKYTVQLAAGTWYVYAPSTTSGGVNIYSIEAKTATQYTLRLVDVNDGIETELETITFNANTSIAASMIASPVKAGYTFKGWKYADGTAVTFPVTADDDLKFVADWETKAVQTYTVTFNSKGGSTVAAKTVEEGTAVEKPADPIYEGYTFKGWFTDEACTTEYNFATPVTGNITLYAKWESTGGVTPDPDPEPEGEGIAIIGLEESYLYTGAKIVPNIGVYDYDADRLLAPGVDYKVTFKNNVKVGTATVTVTGKGNYAQSDASKSFEIVAANDELETLADLTGAKVAKIAPVPYNGEAQYPAIVLTLKGQSAVTYTHSDNGYADAENNPLPANVAVSNNVNKGTANILLTGAKNAKGKDTMVKASFKITPIDLSSIDSKVTVEAEPGVYSVKGAAPSSLKVTYTKDDGTEVELKNGTDFTVKYGNNKTANYDPAPIAPAQKQATITITGKGNYAKKLSVREYRIEKLELTDDNIIAVKAAAGMKVKQVTATVVDNDGNVLKAKTNYSLVITPKADFTALDPNHVLEEGEEIEVKVEPATTPKNMVNMVTGESIDVFKVVTVSKGDISKASVKIAKGFTKSYTGKAVELTEDDMKNITVTLKGVGDLKYDEDFEITGYTANVNKGTATVTLAGKGDYSGFKTFKFKIVGKKMILNKENGDLGIVMSIFENLFK